MIKGDSRLPKLGGPKPKKDELFSMSGSKAYSRVKNASELLPDEYFDSVGIGFSQMALTLEANLGKKKAAPRATTFGHVLGQGSPEAASPSRGFLPKQVSSPVDYGRLHLTSFSERQMRREAAYDAHFQRAAEITSAIEEEFLAHQEQLIQSNYNRMSRPMEERKRLAAQGWLPLVFVVNHLRLFRRCCDAGKAMIVLRQVYLPVWRARRLLRRRLKERQAYTLERAPAMRLPDPRILQPESIFKPWNEKQIRGLIACMRPMCFPAGDTIILQGVAGDLMYLIDNGSVGAYITVGGKGFHHLSQVLTLGRNMLIGEMALICDEPHEMTVRCLEDTDCWALSRKDFMACVAEMGPDSAAQQLVAAKSHQYRVASLVKNNKLQVSQLQALPMFKAWPQSHLEHLLDHFKPLVTSVGDTIVTQGEKGSYLYYVSHGTLSVTLTRANGETEEVDEFHSGSLFGEVPCLFLEPTNITVKCRTMSALWMLPKQILVDELLSNALLLLQARDVANQRRAQWIEPLPGKYLLAVLKRLYPQHCKKMLPGLLGTMQPRVFAEGDSLCMRSQPCNQILIISDGNARSEMTGRTFSPGVALGTEVIGSNWKDTVRATGKVEAWFLFDTQIQKAAEKFLNPEPDV